MNALVFWLAAQIVPGIDVKGFWGALIGSLAVTICTAIVDRYLEARTINLACLPSYPGWTIW